MASVDSIKKKAPFTEDELREFLAARRVVIADPGKYSGRSLRKFLMQFGSHSEDVIVCEDAEEARREIAEKPTHVLFVDAGLGLELIALQQAAFPNRAEIATIVLTPDPSDSELGRIAEADTDSVLIKPFHFQGFRDALEQALAQKIKPSPYTQELERGKSMLQANDLDGAEMVFDGCRSMDRHPTLAYYYLGMIQELRGEFTTAFYMYEKGLEINPKDYRCLTGLFDARLKFGEFAEAYDLAKRIHEDYPVSPSRILELVKLSVHMRRFEDVIDYCQIFQSLEQKDEAMSRVVVAGMLVCAKYLQLREESDRARDVLRNAAKVSLEQKILARHVLRYFIETENYLEGLEYHERLPEEYRAKIEVRRLFVELLHEAKDSATLIEVCGQLAGMGACTPRLYLLMIQHSKKMGRPTGVIENLISEAQARFPDYEVAA